VHSLTLTGAVDLPPLAQQQVIEAVKSRKYDNYHLNEISDQIRDAFQQQGYLKALVGDPTITVLRSHATNKLADVVVSVSMGRRYRLKGISFKSAKVFPASELRREFPIDAGDIFDITKLRTGISQLRRLYVSHGYMNFTPVPDSQIDDGAGLISVNIDVDEGPIFHTGRLTVDGEESVAGARQRMLKAWQSYEGAVFNDEVLKRFLRDVHAPSSLTPDKVFVIEPDNRGHIVNVRITLGRPFNP